MTPSRFFAFAALLLGNLAAPLSVSAGSCTGGATLTITASSDSLTITPTAQTTFNFGEHVILTATASGFTIATYSWTIDGPTIKDYSEDLGTEASPPQAAAIALDHNASGTVGPQCCFGRILLACLPPHNSNQTTVHSRVTSRSLSRKPAAEAAA